MLFLPPQHANHSDSDTVWMTHTKINQIDHIYFTLPQLSHLSSNRRVCNLQLYFQFTTLARELTYRTKFVQPERHKFWQCHNSSLLEPEKCQKSYPERHEFWQRHNSLLPLARESPNSTAKDTNFTQICTH